MMDQGKNTYYDFHCYLLYLVQDGVFEKVGVFQFLVLWFT